MNSRILKSQSRFVLSAYLRSTYTGRYGTTLPVSQKKLQLSQSQKIMWGKERSCCRRKSGIPGIEEYCRKGTGRKLLFGELQNLEYGYSVQPQTRDPEERENGKRKKEKNDVVVTEKMFSHQPPHSPPEQFKAVICYTNPEGGNKVEDVQKMLNAEAAQHHSMD